MSEVQLRQAVAADEAMIKQMVKEEDLDPTSLKWEQFLMAEKDGVIVGIGQVRIYPNCHELGSLIVKEAYRGQGVGGMLVKALVARETGDVYLECVTSNEGYYAQFGFRKIPWWQAPVPLKFKIILIYLLSWYYGVHTIAMKFERS